MSVMELEREWRESLNVECEQGANFSRVKCEEEASQVVYEDKRSSLGHLGDNGSANGPTKCFCVSGRARWSLNNVVLPSEWSEKVKWVWERDYKESESVIELFKLKRAYKELVEILTREGGDKINRPSLSLIHI